MLKNLKFNPENFLVKLPAAYYSNELDMAPAEDIWNFEANALPAEGNRTLCLKLAEGVGFVDLSVFNGKFLRVNAPDGKCVLPVSIPQQRLTFDIRAPGGGSRPLREVTLISPSGLSGAPEEFNPRKRDIKLENCNLLEDWQKSREKIMSENFDLSILAEMRDEIVRWSANRQVTDRSDPHYGAIYSEEDKYCFRDAIFAACCFMRAYLRTGVPEWKERAVAARDYCYKGQYRDSGCPGKDGAWAAMGIIDDPEGKKFRRITGKWAQASGVDTSLIGIMSGELFSMGMEFSERHLKQLSDAVEWNFRNELAYGWFSHHEGMRFNCLNVNFLASSMIYSAHRILLESTGRGLSQEALDEAGAAFRNALECQEAIGVYPYRRADIVRGGKYSLDNFPDNGIGLQAAMCLLKNPLSPFNLDNTRENMRRTALWYLLCSRFEKDHLILEHNASPEYIAGVAFGNFTWCRVTMLDIISQLWDGIGDTGFWKQFCRCHLRTIRETLWNEDTAGKAPINRSAVPGKDLNLVSWIQQAEWAAWVFDNLAGRYGVSGEGKN
jgi:hypothetical protein